MASCQSTAVQKGDKEVTRTYFPFTFQYIFGHFISCIIFNPLFLVIKFPLHIRARQIQRTDSLPPGIYFGLCNPRTDYFSNKTPECQITSQNKKKEGIVYMNESESGCVWERAQELATVLLASSWKP